MKKIYLLALIFISTFSFGQVVIEGTYLPVRGTRILQVYDTTAVALTVPTSGPNQFWNYSNSFVNLTDTFSLATFDPATTPYGSTFPDATHASFLRVPWNSFADSLYSFFRVDLDGFHGVGAWSIKTGYDTSFITNPNELVMKSTVAYGDLVYDTAKSVGYANFNGYNFKWIQHNYKTMEAIGYGTLDGPTGIYNDVLLGLEEITKIDSFFVDIFGNGTYIFNNQIPVPGGNPRTRQSRKYHFLRNNTFASTHLMLLEGDINGNIWYGWYTLPVDFGSISGTVYDTTGLAVTDGIMHLYREHSNFTKNDILAEATIRPDGSFQFDSIPYGEYRIAAKAKKSIYPNSLKTYYGNSLDWVACQTVITTGNVSGIDITIEYHPENNGIGHINGNLSFNGFLKNNDPIPGIDIIVEKDPEDAPIFQGETDEFGNFDFPNLADGNYKLWVDIPGLHMVGTYNFTIAGGTTIDNLNFETGMDSIYPTSLLQNIQQYNHQWGTITSYPNPFDEFTTLNISTNGIQNIKVDLYDLSGKLIRNLVTNYRIIDNGQLIINEPIAPGLYFLNVSVGANSQMLTIVKQ